MKIGDTENNLKEIEAMDRVEMARLLRFAPAGHPAFVTGTPEAGAFDRRFKDLGGMTPEISKRIGWGRC